MDRDETILIVDDEEGIRELCASALQDAGLRVELAPSAAAALMLLESRQIDIVLTDLRMPGMDVNWCDAFARTPPVRTWW